MINKRKGHIICKKNVNTHYTYKSFRPYHPYNKVTIGPLICGVQWYMHERDDDINDPSCPHCHTKEKNWKLDIYNGNIYDYTNRKRYVKTISKKDFKIMWNYKGFLELVLRERQRYDKQYHSKDEKRYPALPPLPLDIIKNKNSRCHNNHLLAARACPRHQFRKKRRFCL